MTDQPEYFGGTPTSATGYSQPRRQNVFNSVWNDFVQHNFLAKGIGSAASAAGEMFNAAMGNTAEATSFQSGIIGASTAARAAAAGIPATQATGQGQAAKAEALQGQSKANLGLGFGPLGVASGATEAAWSYGVARPASTAMLLADPNSPLYKTGSVEQVSGTNPDGTPKISTVPTESGFQIGDVQQAWNRSSDVSFGMAVAGNSLTPYMPGGAIVKMGGLDQYNPWSVHDMASAQSNPFYKFFTGSQDLGLQLVVPPAAKVARLAAMDRLGLSTAIKDASDLNAFRADWERYRTGTPEGTANNTWGQYIEDAARETNPTKLMEKNPIISNSTGVDKGKLAQLIAKTNDPDTVNEIALATMGDQVALKRLFDSAPDHVWALSDMNDTLKNFWVNGEVFAPEGEAYQRINQIFDSAVSRDEYFSEVRRMFTTEDGLPRGISTWAPTRYNEGNGKVWDPLANWLSKQSNSVVESARRAGNEVSYVVRNSDFSAGPQWLHEATKSPMGEPVVRFMHWVGSKQPLGTVTRSGLRPDDLWAELSAGFDDVPFMRGAKELNIGRRLDPVSGDYVDTYMTPSQYRQSLMQSILDGQSQHGLQAAWQAAEDHLVATMARTLGVPEDSLNKIVAGYRKRMDETMTYMQNNNGYLWDEQGQQIRLSPDSRAQMLDSFATLPLGEIYRALRGELGHTIRVLEGAQDGGIALFNAGSKLFRTNVLFRAGYIPRNSIAEPLLASTLSHATILADEGLMASVGNFAQNRVNDLARVRYAVDLNQRIKNLVSTGIPRSQAAQVSKELTSLVVERTQRMRVLEEQMALLEDLKAGKYGPTLNAQQAGVVRGRLVDAQIELQNIEAALDGRLPEWRQVVEPAHLPDLAVRLRELRAMTGQDEAFRASLQQELDDINAAIADRAKASSPRALKQREIDNIQKQIDKVDSSLAKIVGTDDKSAIAFSRQRSNLVSQRDTLIADLDGLDAESAAAPTVMEKSRSEYLRAALKRIDDVRSGSSTPAKAIDPALVKRIQNLQNAYDEIRESFNLPSHDPAAKIQALEKELDSIDRRIGSLQMEQGDLVSRKQAVSGIRAYRGSGNGMMTVWVGGERMSVPAAFSDRALDFGAGYRAEASAADTYRQTFDPSYYSGHRMLRYQLAGGPIKVAPTEPTYWDELAHVGNRFFRGDPLIQTILQASPGEEYRVAAEWLKTPAGIRYQKSMGRTYLETKEKRAGAAPLASVDSNRNADRGVRTVLLDSSNTLSDVIRVVQQYIPDQRVRQILAAREVDSGDLQRLMGGRADLKPVLGEDLIYNPNVFDRASKGVNRALDTVWQFMTSHIEDRIARWPFFQREYRMQLQRRLDVLSSQGLRLTSSETNALRQASARSALEELQKTFYNIRRYSSPVYTARFMVGFPGAFANSFYRYGRFAATQPERTFTALQLYGNLVENAGVDANGNPVKGDLTQAKYLVIPGTKRSATDTGVRIPIAAIEGMTIGLPGLSWLSTLAVSEILKSNPSVEDKLKSALGETGYNTLFPFGIPKNPASVFTSGYQRDLWSLAQKTSDDTFLRIAIESYGDLMATYERNGGAGKPPSFADAVNAASDYLKSTAAIAYANPVATNRGEPGQVARDAWYEIQAAYGPGRQEEARQYYMKQYGDWARWYTYSSRKYQAYIPSTQEAYDRIWNKYPDLVQSLVNWNPDDPSLVSLLAIGTQGQYSPAVNNFINSNPLPGDSVPVSNRMNPEQFDNTVRVADGYAWYHENKAKYDAERKRLTLLRDAANTSYEKAYYRTWISTTDDAWSKTVTEYGNSNVPWMLDHADPSGSKATKAAVYLTKILNDPKFKAEDGSSELWKNIDQFLADRSAAQSAVKSAKTTAEKQAIRKQFYEYVQSGEAIKDPAFSAMFDRYFASEWTDQNL